MTKGKSMLPTTAGMAQVAKMAEAKSGKILATGKMSKGRGTYRRKGK